MAILNGKHKKNSPYASDRAPKTERPGKIRDIRHLRSYVVQRAERTMEAHFEDTIDRQSNNAQESQNSNPKLAVNSAIVAASGIRRARRLGIQHAWDRMRHGTNYRAVKPTRTHSILGKVGLVEPHRRQLDPKEESLRNLLYGPVLTDEEKALWGANVDPRNIKTLKEDMINLSVTRGYTADRAEAFIRSNGITMYPQLVRTYFVSEIPDIPPHVLDRANFLLRLPEQELDQMIDVHVNHPR